MGTPLELLALLEPTFAASKADAAAPAAKKAAAEPVPEPELLGTAAPEVARSSSSTESVSP